MTPDPIPMLAAIVVALVLFGIALATFHDWSDPR